MAEHRVTTVDFVPSLLSAFVDAAAAREFPDLRRVLCIGEALPAETVRRFRDLSAARIDNLYGPTEAAVSVTAHRIDGARRRRGADRRPRDRTWLSTCWIRGCTRFPPE